jgi:hypothetical protein
MVAWQKASVTAVTRVTAGRKMTDFHLTYEKVLRWRLKKY